MINAAVTKVIEIQTDYPARPIILVGMDAGSLLACHVSAVKLSKYSFSINNIMSRHR